MNLKNGKKKGEKQMIKPTKQEIMAEIIKMMCDYGFTISDIWEEINRLGK